MYKYAQLDSDCICVGYKNVLYKESDSNEYVYIDENIDLSDIWYRKYDFATNTFSEEKYYPKVEEVPNGIDSIKDKIDILEAEKEKLLEITKEQDKLLVDNTHKISMLEMNLGGM